MINHRLLHLPGFCVLTLWMLASPASAQEDPSAFPAARCITEVVTLLNEGQIEDITTFAETRLAGPLATEPVAVHVRVLQEIQHRTGGVTLQRFTHQRAHEAAALLQARLTGEWLQVRVQVEPNPPYRIVDAAIDLAPPAKAQHPGPVRAEADLIDELEQFVQRLADADLFSGAVLLARADSLLLVRAYGEANKDFHVPNRIDTRFNLGSMNKMFTALALAQLAEQGRLSFDDALATYLPDVIDADAASKVQLKHLLTHTSGLGNYFNETFHRSARGRFRTIDDWLGLIRGDTLAFEPGTRFRYSNTGMLLAGAVIERVTGQDYYTYVREHVYHPAGMADTDAYALDEVNENLAVGYDKVFDASGLHFRNNLFEHVIRGGPAGGGYSTVEDLWRFARALRTGTLVSAPYVDLLLSPKPELHADDYGYGFRIAHDGMIAGHSGGFPGISANLDLFLHNDYVAVVLSNYSGGSEPVVAKIRTLIPASQ